MLESVTVITPTTGDRPEWLNLVIQDIKNQTVKPLQHIIRVNVQGEDSYTSLNNAISLATTELVAICCDDDRFYPTHLETMLKMAYKADLVYSGNKRIGDMEGECNVEHNSQLLIRRNYITNPLIRKSVWERLGGYSCDSVDCDHKFYRKVDELGYAIKSTGVVTWEYRFHPKQESKVFNKRRS